MPIVEVPDTQLQTAGPTIGLVQHVATFLENISHRNTVREVADSLGVPDPYEAMADARISVLQEAAFVEQACLVSGDIDLGFVAGLALDHGTSLPGYISEHARTLRDALTDAARFLPLVRPGMDFSLEEPGNAAALTMSLSDPGLYAYPRHVECVYAGVIGQIRAFTGRPFYPEELSFVHDRIPVRDEVRSALGCLIRFGAEGTEMLMDSRTPDRSILGRDDALKALLVDHGELLESHSQRRGLNMVERVELFIQHSLPERVPKADAVADALGVSRRSMSRKLAEVETSFGDILARVRLKIAARELQETDHPIGEIAYRLGYTSQASFSTAFKAATGKAPRDYRAETRSAR
ncbi:AraC family transcriptional regulator [Cognatishimia sp. F0-27]|uniref:AraC family transcriptional regulator n=1 Tax=Cognatishimia sp. F0-27 TaxID=2816855 RepID=UPI001D0CB30B|nr:AraC family transcriptional regulator [Cognatishimia sp. F0-27]MCC1492040.1 AraC family transcriptional regulator ligand-binding domain-containing protein [Cognatishimia sp. F0-27]